MVQFLRGDCLNKRQKKKTKRNLQADNRKLLQEAREIEREIERTDIPVDPADRQELYNRILKSISKF